MISKECFCKQIKAIEKYEELIDNFPIWFDAVEAGLFDIAANIFDSLAEEVGDNLKNSLIYTWYYDYDKGTRYSTNIYEIKSDGSIAEIPKEEQIEGGYLVIYDGVIYKPTTAEELYEMFVDINCMKETENK